MAFKPQKLGFFLGVDDLFSDQSIALPTLTLIGLIISYFLIAKIRATFYR